jgi:hypothetical protein
VSVPLKRKKRRKGRKKEREKRKEKEGRKEGRPSPTQTFLKDANQLPY